jgi:TetR/AcrR family transcriptional regulator
MSESARPRRVGRPAADTADLPSDDEIMRRGLAAFAELGYDATSVRELSRRLGVSHNFINDRYGSKEKFWMILIDAAESPIMEHLHAIMSASYDDELMRFRDGVRAFLAMASANPDITRIINQESGARSPRLDYVYRRHVEPIVHAIRPGYDRLVAEGRIRDVPFVVMMFSVIAMTGAVSRRGILDLIAPGSGDDSESFGNILSEVVLEGLVVGEPHR